jgi:membrane fusion protein, multidrug efflux system
MTAIAGCSGGNAAEKGFGGRGSVPVLVAKAVRRTVVEKLYAIGRVEAYSTVDVKSRITDEVAKACFKEGQRVKKGDLLFILDSRPFEAALDAAKADLARDRAQMEQAAADYKRYAYMVEKGVGSRQQYDDARAKYGAIKATVAADQAAVRTAQLNLSYTEIRSPIDGRTGNLMLHAGNQVKANADNGMVVIDQIVPIYVNFALPEKELPRVRAATAVRPLPVEVTIPGSSHEQIKGVLSFIDNAVDTTTGTILCKGLFANRNERLWPGQFVNTALTLGERPDTVLVPSQAVQTGQEGSYVFVVGPKMRAEMRTVATGQTVDGQTVIEHGLRGGETVVTDGQLRLIPGDTVTIKSGL